MKRSTNCLSKLDRMRKTLRHQEADRVPVSDFFWGSFLRRWRDELGLPADTDIYRYYDLDRSDAEAPAAPGWGPGSFQRFLLGHLRAALARRTLPAGGHRHLPLLRP